MEQVGAVEKYSFSVSNPWSCTRMKYSGVLHTVNIERMGPLNCATLPLDVETDFNNGHGGACFQSMVRLSLYVAAQVYKPPRNGVG